MRLSILISADSTLTCLSWRSAHSAKGFFNFGIVGQAWRIRVSVAIDLLQQLPRGSCRSRAIVSLPSAEREQSREWLASCCFGEVRNG